MRCSAFTSKSSVASIHGREQPRSPAGFDRNRNGAALVSRRRPGQRRQIPKGQGQLCVNRAANARRRRKIRDPVPGSLHGVHASRRLRANTGCGRQGKRQFYISMRSQCTTIGDLLFHPSTARAANQVSSSSFARRGWLSWSSFSGALLAR